MKKNDVEGALLNQVARILGEPAKNLDPSRSLSELGVDSVGYCTVSAFVEKKFGIAVPPETLFEFSSIQDTAAHVAQLLEGQQPAAEQPLAKQPVEEPPVAKRRVAKQPVAEALSATPTPTATAADASYSARDIAIVGVACKLPGANSADEYWDLICGGKSVIREFPSGRAPSAETESPGYLKGGFVDDVEAFDAAFFGISRREALAMDPQQRLFLECAWQTFENAGYTTTQLSGSNTAVFAGVSSFDYYELLLRRRLPAPPISERGATNRVSQFFNLARRAIDTACSSGLGVVAGGRDAAARRARWRWWWRERASRTLARCLPTPAC